MVGGSILIALAVNVFLDPNDVVPGGFTALAMFANRLWDWPIGVTLFVLNAPFLVLGTLALGADFGPKTIFTAICVSAAIDLLQPYVPQVTGEPFLYTIFGGVLFGLGQGIVFRADATSGGTEIPAKLLQHCYNIRMSRSLLAMDVVILGLAGLFFGLAPALYALITAWVMARVVDFAQAGVNDSSSVLIITQEKDAVRQVILDELDRGVTVLHGEGGYTGYPREVLLTVIKQSEVKQLRKRVSQIDQRAFMVVSPSNEVLGEGFHPLRHRRLLRRRRRTES